MPPELQKNIDSNGGSFEMPNLATASTLFSSSDISFDFSKYN